MPLRVLQVDGGVHPWDGTLRYVVDLSRALAARGHAVTLACPGGSVLDECARKLDLPRIGHHMRGPHDWKQLPRLARRLAQKYDVVHIHSPIDYAVAALAARIARTPAVVMTRHLSHPFASRLNAYVCCRLLYDRIIAVSDFVRAVMVRSGAPPDRIEVVYNGIGAQPISGDGGSRLRRELGIPEDAIVVGAAGRLSWQKGFDVLVKAIGALIRSGTHVYCIILGGGQMRQELENLCRQLEIETWVRLPGFRTAAYDLWSTADVAVVPSVWEEPFGYTALEALSAGCALVVSRTGGLQEIVSRDSALMAEPGSVSDLAGALARLVRSPDLRSMLRANGKIRASMFSVAAHVTAVERLYSTLLDR